MFGAENGRSGYGAYSDKLPFGPDTSGKVCLSVGDTIAAIQTVFLGDRNPPFVQCLSINGPGAICRYYASYH